MQKWYQNWFHDIFIIVCNSIILPLLDVWRGCHILLRRGYKISARNFQRRNLALSQTSVKACYIPVCRVWPLVSENVFRFTLVAMVTKQRLWLAKQQNKRNSKTIHSMVTIFGVWVYMDNTHKTMKPDFLIGCHGNR